jgi:hypothetical protein
LRRAGLRADSCKVCETFGVGAPWYSELFAAHVRCSGASLGFQIGAAINGGLTSFAAATLPISVYLIMQAVITFSATMAAPENGRPAVEVTSSGRRLINMAARLRIPYKSRFRNRAHVPA